MNCFLFCLNVLSKFVLIKCIFVFNNKVFFFVMVSVGVEILEVVIEILGNVFLSVIVIILFLVYIFSMFLIGCFFKKFFV